MEENMNNRPPEMRGAPPPGAGNGAPPPGMPGRPDPKAMKKVGLLMSLFMGITLSIFLSLTGLLQSGQSFTFLDFLLNFGISFVISMVIGFIVPMKKVGESAVRGAKLRPGSWGARFLESLISDLIYTPVITVAMVTIAYFNVMSHIPEGVAGPPYVPMLIKSLLISLGVGYVLIFIFMPLYLKLSMKLCGIAPPPGAPPRPRQ